MVDLYLKAPYEIDIFFESQKVKTDLHLDFFSNVLPGVLNLPAVALGILLGGLVMKRYKLSMVSGTQLYFATSITAYLLTLLYFSTKCDNVPVAGLTVSYNG